MDDVRLIDANALRKDIHTSYSDDLGILEHIDNAPTIDAIPREKWNKLKETIIEMMDSGGTATQKDVCKFFTNLMEVLEKEGKNDGLNR